MTLPLPVSQITAFQQKILSWYELNKRDLPWRDVPVGTSLQERAYRILVSEVMLQQTQVVRVIPKYKAWLKAFPTVESLAHAQTAEVLRLWSGLGYNRRALYLKKAAECVTVRGSWPKTSTELQELPGIGEYTARALLCFAFNKQVAVVDTNVRKVILTQLDSALTIRQVQEVAEKILPKGKAYEWNQALMDYSSVVLKNQKIPMIKQSKFVGSNRYYRGILIKALTEKKELTTKEIQKLFGKDEDFTKRIITSLNKDNLITIIGDRTQLP